MPESKVNIGQPDNKDYYLGLVHVDTEKFEIHIAGNIFEMAKKDYDSFKVILEQYITQIPNYQSHYIKTKK
jgi:hypothetical protein